MTTPAYFVIAPLSVVDITGNDADAIIHNLTTNEIKSLARGNGCETFVTDVKGKTLGHVHLFRHDDRLRMVGPAGQSDAIASHIDRYTIREDATPQIRDQDFIAVVVPPESPLMSHGVLKTEPVVEGENPALHRSTWQLAQSTGDCYGTRWLGEGTLVLLVPTEKKTIVTKILLAGSELPDAEGENDEAEFHTARIRVGFPWYGIDIDSSNLPQEVDRDSMAVSFTKGCYLGQETVARLDALGQVQRKLVRWAIDRGVPPAGSTLVCGEKTVGRLTSVTPNDDGGAIAIGMARRSHFEPGATATGSIESSEETFTGTVV